MNKRPVASSVALGSPRLESGYHHSITWEQARHRDASLRLRPAWALESQKTQRNETVTEGQRTVSGGYLAR